MELLGRSFDQRAIRQNHSVAYPKRMLFLDIETKWERDGNREKHRLKLAWTCYVERRSGERKDTEAWKEWKGTKPLCDYIEDLCQNKTVLYLFGHNVFFDLQASDFFHFFTRAGWILDFVMDKGGSYILSIHKGKRRLKVLSTTNYFPTSLAALGKMINLPKLDIDLEHATGDELSVYCRRDVEITKRAMEFYFQFVQDNDFGKFGLTRAGQAFSAYRHRFMKKKIYVHKDEGVQNLERSAYYGGRVECFRIGKIEGGPFVSLDVNSMYPYLMLERELPYQLVDYRENYDLGLLAEALPKFSVIGDCYVETDKPIYPVRRKGKLFFPVGKFRTCLCTPEISMALAKGHLKRLYRASFYRKALLFTEYVKTISELKNRYQAEGNPVMRTLCKTLLNSLYGKFAQYVPETRSVTDFTCDGYWRMESIDLVSGEREMEYKLFNKRVIEKGKHPGNNSLIALSAHVTSWGRLYLWELMERVGQRNVLYCDTDSVKLRQSAMGAVSQLMNPNQLGALWLESRSKQLTIHGAKHYETEEKRTLKGVPKDAVEFAPQSYEYYNWPKQATHMAHRITRYYFREHTIKWTPSRYDKGIVGEDGSVRPLKLYERDEEPKTPELFGFNLP